MADHAAVHAVHDPNIGNTGLDNRKVGMWVFLGSDCMFFGSLIGTYLSYKGKSHLGPAAPRGLRHPAHLGTARRCCSRPR